MREERDHEDNAKESWAEPVSEEKDVPQPHCPELKQSHQFCLHILNLHCYKALLQHPTATRLILKAQSVFTPPRAVIPTNLPAALPTTTHNYFC